MKSTIQLYEIFGDYQKNLNLFRNSRKITTKIIKIRIMWRIFPSDTIKYRIHMYLIRMPEKKTFKLWKGIFLTKISIKNDRFVCLPAHSSGKCIHIKYSSSSNFIPCLREPFRFIKISSLASCWGGWWRVLP